MRIFLTGATGFIGSRVARELMTAGHQVLGLTRTTAGAEQLMASGVEVHFGNIDSLDSLQRGARLADGVIHTAFNHDFFDICRQTANTTYRVIDAMGTALGGDAKTTDYNVGCRHGIAR
ncbi:Putative NADH-flavin reductase [Kluyvera cryocrescens]|uniref:NADH-flavin reductase n=1 Tax=Kluyvera cryocrescens TaxID=580 RepID=A0A485ABH1_KLUCR|nr:Putative NADH-flavin reductase [Kluyvera cryocrescens]